MPRKLRVEYQGAIYHFTGETNYQAEQEQGSGMTNGMIVDAGSKEHTESRL